MGLLLARSPGDLAPIAQSPLKHVHPLHTTNTLHYTLQTHYKHTTHYTHLVQVAHQEDPQQRLDARRRQPPREGLEEGGLGVEDGADGVVEDLLLYC